MGTGRLVLIVTFVAACQSRPEATSPQALEQGLLGALEKGDVEQALAYFLDPKPFKEGCVERFKDGDADFLRQLEAGKRRFAHYFDECRVKVVGAIKVLSRSGGRKKKQSSGCGEQTWEYEDVDLRIEAGGRLLDVSIDGIIGVAGKYYVVERLWCR